MDKALTAELQALLSQLINELDAIADGLKIIDQNLNGGEVVDLRRERRRRGLPPVVPTPASNPKERNHDPKNDSA